MSATETKTKPVGHGMTWCGIVLIILGIVVALAAGTIGMFFLPGLLGVALIAIGYMRRLLAAVERR
jgi:hypothetical protein